MAKKTGKLPTLSEKPINEESQDEFEEMLWGNKAEVETYDDLMKQRGTPIPTLFGLWYPFVQNPSSISIETFKRMVDTDDTIGAGVDFLTSCLAARLGRYQHENDEITEFVNVALDRMQGGFQNAIKEMLSATWTGFSVSEIQWEDNDLGFVPRRLVTLPPMTLLFEMDRAGELTEDGILQYQRNWNPLMQGPGNGFGNSLGVGIAGGLGGGRNDPFGKLGDLPFPLRSPNPYSYLCLRIPKQKCVHYAFDAQGKFGNPYGRSLLRRIYKYYVIKDAILQMMTIALDRKGTPLTVVYADPNTTLESPDKNPTGANPRGQKSKGIRADQAAREAFKNIHNDSVIILPGKKGEIFEIQDMPMTSNASDFIAALDFCNKSFLRGLLIPSLIFGNGDGTGSFALGQEHAKTFDKILDSMLGGFQAALLDQFIRQIIAYNFPESSWKKQGLGGFTKRTLTQDEIQKEMETFEKGVNVGVIDQQDLADLNKMRETIGFEPRDTPIEKPMPFGGGMFGEDGEVDEEGNPIPPAEGAEKDPKDGKKPVTDKKQEKPVTKEKQDAKKDKAEE